MTTVSQFGGHASAEAARVSKLGSSDMSKHVGFVLVWKGDKTVQIRWNSGTINARNFGQTAAPAAPAQQRPVIINAVESVTRVRVIE